MVICSVKGCYSSSKYSKEKRTFFTFPWKNIARATQWYKFCCDETMLPGAYKKRCICDLHFLDSDFAMPNRLGLKRHTVPTINGPKRVVKRVIYSQSKDPKLNLSFVKLERTEPSEIGMSIDCSNVKSNLSEVNTSDSSEDTSSGIYNKSKQPSKTIEKNQETIQNPEQTLRRSRCVTQKKAKYNKPSKKTNNSQQYNKCKNYQTSLNPTISKGFPLSKSSILNSSYQAHTTKENKDIKSKLVFPSISDLDVSPTLFIPSPELASTNERSVDQSVSNNSTKDTLTRETTSDSVKSSLLVKNKSTIPLSYQRSNQNKDERIKINVVRKKRFVKNYKRNLKRNKRLFGTYLNSNDPRYSIAATTESLGTFNTVMEPLELVDLEAGEWQKLYYPNVGNLPIMPESYLNPMTNQLRAQLPFLKERDKLDVSFLLSMMSAYPGAPKHIKELLVQRLNLLYIAIMFKWDTALSLITKENLKVVPELRENSTNFSSTLERTISNPDESPEKTKTNTPHTNENAWMDLNCSALSDLCTSKPKQILPEPVKPFKFEIIVKKNNFKRKEDENQSTVNMSTS